MFSLSATKVTLTVTQTETITSGAVNVFFCQFTFDENWDGLDRTAIFVAGSVSVSLLLDSTNSCAIPWEVLQYANRTLMVGVYGTTGETLVLPTIWASLGTIQPGAVLSPSAQDPTPTVYQQILNTMGDLSALETSNKSSLVAAINEIYESGGGGGISSPNITQILVMSQADYNALETKSPTTLYLITG